MAYTAETVDESNNTDVYLVFSDDIGVTWSTPVLVHPDSTVGSQFLPRVAVDPNDGDVAVVWYDTRLDTGAGGVNDPDGVANTNPHVFMAVSIDYGATFLDGLQVSALPSSENGAEPVGAGFTDADFGRYLGAQFRNGRVQISWTDNSNSTGDNPGGALNDFDIYTTIVTTTQTRSISRARNFNNASNPNDVNGDGHVDRGDLAALSAAFRHGGVRELNKFVGDASPGFLDIDDDSHLSATDLAMMRNLLADDAGVSIPWNTTTPPIAIPPSTPKPNVPSPTQGTILVDDLFLNYLAKDFFGHKPNDE